MTCKHCDFIHKLGEPQTNREYWIITEIFVHLHSGKDYCETSKSNKPNIKNCTNCNLENVCGDNFEKYCTEKNFQFWKEIV